MEKSIKINKTNCLSYQDCLEAVQVFIIYKGFENNSYGIKVSTDRGVFHVKCRTTPNTYIFDVWLAI